jgi:hypothetical protein
MPRTGADFEGLLRAFAGDRVRFVVIGGVSAAMQGVPTVTYDLDLVLAPAPDNLDRAHGVLEELGTLFREHLPRRLAPRREDLESGGALLLLTGLGPLDIRGRVSTGWSYDDLVARARTVRVDDELQVDILDLAALIEIKERIGREKDKAVLPLYRRTLAERREAGEGDGG